MMRWGVNRNIQLLATTCALALPLFLASCAATSLTIGEFSDQVLEPLAAKLANERIDQALAETQATSGTFTALGSIFGPQGALIGGGLDWLSTTDTNQRRAALEAHRLPLKKELLTLFESRTKATGEGYAVCVDGIERRYTAQDGKFLRGENGTGPCPTVAVKPY